MLVIFVEVIIFVKLKLLISINIHNNCLPSSLNVNRPI